MLRKVRREDVASCPFSPHASRIAAHCIARHHNACATPAKTPRATADCAQKAGSPSGPHKSHASPLPRGSCRHIGAGPSRAGSPFSWRCSQDRANDVAGECETAIAMTRCLSRSSPRRKMNPLDVKASRSGFSPFPGTRAWGGLESPCLTAQP